LARCEVCDAGPQFGRHIRHSASGRWERKAPRKQKVWSVNVQRKRLVIDGRYQRVKICTRCIRTVDRLG